MVGKRVLKGGKEDYLRAIWESFEHEDKGIKSVDIAKKLGISKASVSEMLRKLADEGLVKVEPYSKIFLTRKGINLAKNQFDNHFVVKSFLKKYLGYEDEKTDKEAHNLEHAFSDESISILDELVKGRKAVSEMPGYIG